MLPIAEIPFLHALIPTNSGGMDWMQWLAFAVGMLLIATRLPGLLFPKAYRRVALFAARGRPGVLRVAGAFLLLVAMVIIGLIIDTLEPMSSMMLILAVVFVLGGGLVLFFPEAYQRVAEKALTVMPTFALRLVSFAVVPLGLIIVVLSTTV